MTVSHPNMYLRSGTTSTVYIGLVYSCTEMYWLAMILSPILTRILYPPGLKFEILRLPVKVPSGDRKMLCDVITGGSSLSGKFQL